VVTGAFREPRRVRTRTSCAELAHRARGRLEAPVDAVPLFCFPASHYLLARQLTSRSGRRSPEPLEPAPERRPGDLRTRAGIADRRLRPSHDQVSAAEETTAGEALAAVGRVERPATSATRKVDCARHSPTALRVEPALDRTSLYSHITGGVSRPAERRFDGKDTSVRQSAAGRWVNRAQGVDAYRQPLGGARRRTQAGVRLTATSGPARRPPRALRTGIPTAARKRR
jgi:hypothetical protein